MTKVIAEIGCNHKGDINIAKQMIETLATYCKVDVVKFQKRCVKELLTDTEYNSPHPNPENSYGKTYGEHREFLEFDIEQHKELKEYCEKFGVEYSCSVWDLTSAKEIVSLATKFIKVPSACNANKELLEYLLDNYDGDIHISLGMTTEEERDNIVHLFYDHNREKNLVLYACTSGYPVTFKDVCLGEIYDLYLRYPGIKNVGFSGHHLGIAIDSAAAALGAKFIERHFTLDRTWKGTDHAASLEPDGMRKLVRDVHAVEQAMGYKYSIENGTILDIEKAQREKLKKSQIKWDK